ncbi:hypothetical protein FKM82_008129 [Ascaphus truei]
MRTLCWLPALLALLHTMPPGSHSVLPAPTNVKIHSYNLKQVLKWDPVKVENVTYNVTYRVGYNAFYDNDIHSVCENITETQCDFPEEIKVFWRVRLRVRAELGELKSNWAETPIFQATRNTTIGPVKSLTLTSSKEDHNSLYVSFLPPFSSIPQQLDLRYNLSYWKASSGLKKPLEETQKTSIKLTGLEAGTRYCVQVNSFTPNLDGQISGAVCETTTAAVLTTAGYIALFVSVITVFIAALVCLFLIHKYSPVIKRWLNPPCRIPLHIEQYLQDPDLHVCVQESENKPVLEDQYDLISIVETEFFQSTSAMQTFPEDSSQSAEKT